MFLLSFVLCLTLIELVGNAGHGIVDGGVYLRFWIGAQLVSQSLYVLALTEACTRSLESYTKFAEIGNQVIRVELIISGLALVIAVFVLPDPVVESVLRFMGAETFLAHGSLAVLGASTLAFAGWARLRLVESSRLVAVVLTLLGALSAVMGGNIGIGERVWAASFGILTSVAAWLYLAWRWRSLSDVVSPPVQDLSRAEIEPALAEMEELTRQLGELVRRG